METAVSALLGAIIGGLLTLSGSLVTELRRERLAVRAAARLTSVELAAFARSMRQIVKTGEWWMPDHPASREWEAHRAMLAVGLDPADWLVVHAAYISVESFARNYERTKQQHTPSPDQMFPAADEHDRTSLEYEAAVVESAIRRLKPAAEYEPAFSRNVNQLRLLRARFRTWDVQWPESFGRGSGPPMLSGWRRRAGFLRRAEGAPRRLLRRPRAPADRNPRNDRKGE